MSGFERPAFLALLVTIALPLSFEAYRWRSGSKQVERFGKRELIDSHSERATVKKRAGSCLIAGIAIALIVLAMAGPESRRQSGLVPRDTAAFVAVVDTSRSMAVEDYSGGRSRLEMVSDELLDVYTKHREGRSALISFADVGFVHGDITNDLQALSFITKNWLKVGAAPGFGSDLSDGFGAAYELLEAYNETAENKIKSILLFTDGGESDINALVEILDEIKAGGYRVIVIGVGTLGGGPVPVYDEDGKRTGYYERGDAKIVSRLNEPLLKRVAKYAQGEYVRLDRTGVVSALSESFVDRTFVEDVKEESLAKYFVAAVILMIALYVLVLRFVR